MTDTPTNPETGVDSGPYDNLSDAAAGILGLMQRDNAPSNEPEPDADPEPTAEQPEAEAEADPETEAETPEDADPEPEAEPEQPSRYTVKIDGQEHEVTLDELLNGYQREADYRRKTQEIAAQRREAEAAAQQIAQERQAYAERLEQFQSLLKSEAVPTDEQIQQALATDPAEAVRLIYARDQHKARLAEVEQELTKTRQAQQEEAQKAYRQMIAEGMKRLPELIPEWSDEKVRKEEQGHLRTYLQGLGATPEEINGLADPRLVAMARKAWKYDQIQQAKPAVQKRVEKAPVLTKPGAATNRKAQEVERVRAMEQRLGKTGRTEDAAALIRERIFGKQ